LLEFPGKSWLAIFHIEYPKFEAYRYDLTILHPVPNLCSSRKKLNRLLDFLSINYFLSIRKPLPLLRFRFRRTVSAPRQPSFNARNLIDSVSQEQTNSNNKARHIQDASPRLSKCIDTVCSHRKILRVRQPHHAKLAPSNSSRAPPANIDQTVSDFDGVTFHISTPESKTKIVVSIQVKCYNELLKYGAQQVLEREYGPFVIAPENGYNFSVQVDLESLPEDKGESSTK
jgi:hypothetical protein